jgi:hypothetical protein
MPLVGDFKACTECVFITKKCSFETKTTLHAIRPGYSLKGCPPAEPFSASPGRLKIKQKEQKSKMSY